MAIEYTNRKGKCYYLHTGETKTGKPAYFFSRKKEGPLATSIPDGYEIREKPNAQVYLQKITPKLFTDAEIAAVKNGVKRLAGLKRFMVEVEKNAIVVYLPDSDEAETESLVRELSRFNPFAPKDGVEWMLARDSYTAMLRFVLIDKKSREFAADRWCFRGRIDGWIRMDAPSELKALVKAYCPHLGKESFYELVGLPLKPVQEWDS